MAREYDEANRNCDPRQLVEYIVAQNPVFSDVLAGAQKAHRTFCLIFVAYLSMASENRRSREGHAGLIEDAARMLVAKYLYGFMSSNGTAGYYRTKDYPEAVARLLADEVRSSGYLALYVTDFLREGALSLAEQFKSPTEEHPMRTLRTYLDFVEHIKEVDVDAYKRSYPALRHAVALHRVGMAVLPPATWQHLNTPLGDLAPVPAAP